MAKSGTVSTLNPKGSSRSAGTRKQLVEATIETLKDHGFAGASARTIAERAGANQGLIFYHFGSVANLLLAALDAVSESRMKKYSSAVEGVRSPTELAEIATSIFREDLDAGYATVLVELIVGASSTPGFGAEVATRIDPWFAFARDAVDKVVDESPLSTLVPSEDLAHGVVAMYLGLEMLSHLSGDRAPALRLFSRVQQMATLIENLAPSSKPEVSK
jgi:AcrR family transcriptional regulator